MQPVQPRKCNFYLFLITLHFNSYAWRMAPALGSTEFSPMYSFHKWDNEAPSRVTFLEQWKCSGQHETVPEINPVVSHSLLWHLINTCVPSTVRERQGGWQ